MSEWVKLPSGRRLNLDHIRTVTDDGLIVYGKGNRASIDAKDGAVLIAAIDKLIEEEGR